MKILRTIMLFAACLLVCVRAVAGPVERARVVETGLDDREANMWRFAEAALTLLAEALEEA